MDKKTDSGAIASVNEQLPEELHQPVIKKLKGRKVYSRFKNNIWAANLAEMESLSSKIRNIKYLLCAINVFVKYTWVKPLKYEKGEAVLTGFLTMVNNSNRKQITK